MSIKQYLKQAIKENQIRYGEPVDIDYRAILMHQGYPSVLLGRQGHDSWKEVHQWCKELYGEEHYTWTGSRFWFENDCDAMWFALRWS